VYDHPASPFVLEFLGHVNRLPVTDSTASAVYARPHEIAVSLHPVPHAWLARLEHSATVGPVTRLEFAIDDHDRPINVELPRDQFRALALTAGSVAYLTPTRLRHFAEAA